MVQEKWELSYSFSVLKCEWFWLAGIGLIFFKCLMTNNKSKCYGSKSSVSFYPSNALSQ